jgi:hypothetical protein
LVGFRRQFVFQAGIGPGKSLENGQIHLEAFDPGAFDHGEIPRNLKPQTPLPNQVGELPEGDIGLFEGNEVVLKLFKSVFFVFHVLEDHGFRLPDG